MQKGKGSTQGVADKNTHLGSPVGLCWPLTAETWSFQNLRKPTLFFNLLQEKSSAAPSTQ